MVSIIIRNLFTGIVEVITGIGDALGSVLSAFWTPGVGETPGTLTDLGSLSIVTLSVGLGMVFFSWVWKLFRVRG